MDLESRELLYQYQAQHDAAYDRLRHKRFARRPHRAAVLDCPDNTVQVWADLHLGHERVIDFAGRPFLDAADQDAHLWRAWAEDVGRGDVLVVVGDLAMGPARKPATWARLAHAPGRRNHQVRIGIRLLIVGVVAIVAYALLVATLIGVVVAWVPFLVWWAWALLVTVKGLAALVGERAPA